MPSWCSAVSTRAPSWTTDELIVARQVTAVGRSRAYLGGAQVPAPVCAPGDRGADRHPRPVRADPAGRGRPAAGAAGPVRRREPSRRCWPATARGTPNAEPRRPSWTGCGPRRRRGPGRSTCCGSGWPRSSGSTPRPGEDVALAAEAPRLQSADDLRLAAAAALARVAGADDEAGRRAQRGHRRPQGAGAGADATRRWPSSAGGWPSPATGWPTWRLTWPATSSDLEAEPGRLEQIAERRSPAGRPDPQVRVERSTRCCAWASRGGRPAGRAGGQRRPDRAAGRPGGRAGRRAGRAGRPITAARQAAARRPSPTGWSPSWCRWRCRTPGWPSSVSPGRARPVRGRPGRAAVQRQPGQRAAQPGQGGLRRRAVPGPARPGGGAGRRPDRPDPGLRRGRRRGRRPGGDGDRPPAGPARPAQPGGRGHPPGPGGRVRRPALRGGQGRRRPGHHQRRTAGGRRAAGRRAGPDDGRPGGHRVGAGPCRRAGRAGRARPADQARLEPRPERERARFVRERRRVERPAETTRVAGCQ